MTQTTNNHNNLFASKEEYQAFISRWKELARAKKLTAQDCLLRCLLLKQDVSRALPVTKNATRLANGAAEDSGLQRAARALRGAHPVADYERRAHRAAELQARERPIPDYLRQPTWAEGWVDVLKPQSFDRGLAVARFVEAAELARGVSA